MYLLLWVWKERSDKRSEKEKLDRSGATSPGRRQACEQSERTMTTTGQPLQIPTPALDRILKHHARSCTYFIFSGDRHCSCGRDQARGELTRILETISKPQKVSE